MKRGFFRQNFIRDLKLRDKLLMTYFVLIFLPLALSNLFSFRVVNDIIEKQIIYSASQAFDQATDFLSYKINKIIGVSDSIAVNTMVKTILEKDINNYPIEDQYEDLNTLKTFFSSFKKSEDVYDICLYVREAIIHSDVGADVAGIRDAQLSQWYGKLSGAGSRVLMCPPSFSQSYGKVEDDILSVARRITSSDNYLETIGYLRIDFLEKNIRSILSNVNSVNGSLTYIRDSDDRIISTTDKTLLAKYKLSLAQIGQLANKNRWSSDLINTDQVYLRTRLIPDTNWTVVTIIPTSRIFSEIMRLKSIMLIFMVVLGVVSYLISLIISFSVSKRIHRLSTQMATVSDNELNEYTHDTDSKDEVGDLVRSYNFMLRRIKVLVDEQYKSGQELRGAELKALQAQINPHFLYNTLDMINWMSYEDKGSEIRQIVRALSQFYKISLSKGKSVISLQDEINHVMLYMQIQNLRFNEKIKFIMNGEPDLLGYGIPKITLQPIVENAILHGILEKPEKSGNISLTITEEDQKIVILVSDDGVGMDEERISSIWSDADNAYSSRGFGLKNINHRMMIFFNIDNAIEISSEKGIGTTVKVAIPKFVMRDN